MKSVRLAYGLLVVLSLSLGCAASSSEKPPATGGQSGGGSSGVGGSTAGTGGGASGGSGGGAPTGGSGGDATGGTAAGGNGGAPANPDGGLDAPTDVSLTPFTGFGPNVIVFDPTMSSTAMQKQIDDVYATQWTGQFSTDRYAFLFKPGKYSLDVTVGYYTQVLGLGAAPDDVTVTGAIRSMGNATGNATLSFWRAVENAAVTPGTTQNGQDIWAVSQGASFRRMHVAGNLMLADTGTSSGGFIADAKIDGKVTSASQQQYFTRDTEWTSWVGGVWNMVFVGVNTPPTAAWPGAPNTVVDQAPVAQEKPFLTIDGSGKYAIVVPAARANAKGASWTTGANAPAPTTLSLDAFYVARAGRDGAAEMNAALAQGKHLLLEPGIYHLTQPLHVTRAGTIVMGLGLATLVADAGTAAISVADVDGVKIAGLIVDAGATNSATLIEVGEGVAAAAGASHASSPTWLYDLSCRIGGGSAGTATTCLTIDSNDVVGDNLWLWRADHGTGVGWTSNVSKNGLVVNGKNVTMYGLFVEHFQQYQTIWNGEGGRVYFYQSEMPYDPPSPDMWTHDGVAGYASYKVAAGVTTHEAWGMGVYCAFRNDNVVADAAFEAPTATNVALHHLVTVWPNGKATTSINHVLNSTGAAANMTVRKVTAN
ncbi:MAG TPA: coagulation factor 5/8 type domain-containing protein [Polyangia bacterium]|nr:coagulation factor 5/8 type domain-containing protein [Polyangia bacterium]